MTKKELIGLILIAPGALITLYFLGLFLIGLFSVYTYQMIAFIVLLSFFSGLTLLSLGRK